MNTRVGTLMVDVESTRKAFEAEIYYRQFLDRNADGSYNLGWVNELWRGWVMAVSLLGLRND